jgi:tetratricopeptide (TPR) repeat protein
MSSSLTPQARLAILCILLAITAGCSGIASKLGVGQDVAQEQERRQAKLLRDFSARRDEAQYQAALARYRTGGTDEAKALLEKLLTSSPDHLPARLALAEILLIEERPEAALEHIRFVTQRAPGDPSARHLEGLAHDALGQQDAAFACFEQATKLDPKNEIYRATFQTAVEGLVGQAENPVAQAPESDALAIAHDEPLLQSSSPAEPAQTGPAAPGAADDADRALASAAQALQLNRPDEAVAILTSATERTPSNAGLWRALGAAHYRRGEYDRAQVVLRKALSLDSAHPLSYFLLGATLRQLGQTTEAERNLALAAEIDSRYAAWQ